MIKHWYQADVGDLIGFLFKLLLALFVVSLILGTVGFVLWFVLVVLFSLTLPGG